MLRWRLLRGALRRGGSQAVTIVLGTAVSFVAGLVAGVAVAVAGHVADDPEPMLVVAPLATTVAVVAIGLIAGVAQPVDPRVVAAEPLSDRHLALGLLTATASGPPGLAAGLVGIGLLVAAISTPASVVPAVLATVSLLATLLLVSRTTGNVLGLFTNRYPRAGQIVVALVSLVFYGMFQFAPMAFVDSADDGRRAMADVARFTPPGQLGQALADADASVGASLGHLVVGSSWLPVLALVFAATTRRLLVSAPSGRATPRRSSRRRPLGAVARWACGRGVVGAIAWRSVRTRLRNPRSALETLIGGGVGMAIVLVPALAIDVDGAPAVLVGVAVQLSVLFMAGNSIGSDGPAIASELLCGIEPETMIAAKARSIIVVASPTAILGALVASGVTGDWRFLPAGLLVGIGGVLASAGGAMMQSTFVPVAVPESDNPLESGDSGSGILSALVLGVVMVVLALATLPVGLALLWALDRGSVPLVSLLAIVTLVAGVVILRVSSRIAARRWRGNEPEIYEAIVPAS